MAKEAARALPAHYTLGFQRSTSKQDNSDVKVTTTDFGLNANTLGNLFTVGMYYTFRGVGKQENNRAEHPHQLSS
jgi:hypothetical protein